MPELLEVEVYRRAAQRCVGRVVSGVHVPDAWYVKGGVDPQAVIAALSGIVITGTRRRGKLAMLDTSETTLGLRFGMTGRIVIDGELPISELEYSSNRVEPRWERFALDFADGGRLAIVDPRRLGGVELEPEVSRLGPDALDHHWTAGGLAAALVSVAPLKATLLDQSRIAGLGNLLVDELLWRSALDPSRASSSLTSADWKRLSRHLPVTLGELGERGGSHTGDLQPARSRGATCPRDGEPLRRDTIGGRTTYWCPRHQR